jgi:WD40 repeat protein
MTCRLTSGVRRAILLSLIIVALNVQLADADKRVWTDHQGHRLEAEFVRTHGDYVVLRDSEGRERSFRIADFSAADRSYIREIAANTADEVAESRLRNESTNAQSRSGLNRTDAEADSPSVSVSSLPEEYRTWTTTKGRSTPIPYRFSGMGESKVVLGDRNGNESRVALDQLCDNDRAYIRRCQGQLNWRAVETESLVDQSVRILATENSHVTDLAFSPDGKRAAWIAEDQRLSVCDVKNGMVTVLCEGSGDDERSHLTRVGFSADGELLITGRQGAVEVWELAKGTLRAIHRPDETDGTYGRLWISSIGTFAAIHHLEFGKEVLHLWAPRDEEPFITEEIELNRINNAVFSHDGTQFAMLIEERGGDRRSVILRWDLKAQRALPMIRVDDFSGRLAFSRDKRFLASVGNRYPCRVSLWDLSVPTCKPRPRCWSPNDRNRSRRKPRRSEHGRNRMDARTMSENRQTRRDHGRHLMCAGGAA